METEVLPKKYHQRAEINKTYVGGLLGIVVGGTLSIGSLFMDQKPNIPEAIEYIQITRSISELEKIKEINPRLYDIPYQTPEMQKQIETALPSKEIRVSSLNRAIELAEENEKRLGETPEVQQYLSDKKVTEEREFYGILTGAIISLGSFGISLYALRKKEEN